MKIPESLEGLSLKQLYKLKDSILLEMSSLQKGFLVVRDYIDILEREEWEGNKEKFGNDGIDYKNERVMPAFGG